MAERRPARLRAVPRAHEHLRRPRQPADARAPLRVARDRLRALRRDARRAARSRRRRPASTSAAARTATSACARSTWPRPSATALHARGRARRRSCSRVCGGYQLLGTSYALGRGDPARRRPRRPRDGPRRRPAADRQRRDRGRPRRATGRARAGRLREPRRPHPPRRRRAAARPGPRGPRQQRPRRRRGRRAAASVIGTYLHGPLLPKNAWFADWLIAPRARPRRTSPRSTTRSRTPRTPRRGRGSPGRSDTPSTPACERRWRSAAVKSPDTAHPRGRPRIRARAARVPRGHQALSRARLPPAVDELSLEVPAGEICVLVGPSGCGKTTAMRMVNRMIDITVGRHPARRRAASSDRKPAELRREIGYVDPADRPLPAPDDRREHRHRARSCSGWDKERIGAARRRAARAHRPARRDPRPLPGPALGRPAPARRRRPRPGRRPAAAC